MKIFANNFALFFTTEPAHRHFRFELRTLPEIARWLREEELMFPGQVAWLSAAEHPDLVPGLLGLLQDEAIAEKYGQVSVVFPDQAALEHALAELRAGFKPVTAAGGLVFGPADDLLLILRHGRWDLPKGKVEKQEAIADAAWREVAEETGLQDHVTTAPFAETYHVFRRYNGKWRFKTTHWYRMHCPTHPDLAPQTEEGITEVRWTSLDQLKDNPPVTYPQIMELIRDAAVS